MGCYNSEGGLYRIVHNYTTTKEGNKRMLNTEEVMDGNEYEKRMRGAGDRDSRMEIRMSSDELTALKQIAKSEGMTASAWIREKVAQYKYAI